MSEPVTPEFLKGLAFLTPVTDDEARALAAVSQAEQYPAGTALFREGDHLKHIYIVTAGIVAIEIYGPERRARRIYTVGPGELLGWSPVLHQGAMTATARALTDTRLIAVDARAILDICDKDPRFGFLFMKRTASAIAARLSATRLQLLDVYGTEIPAAPEGVES